MFPFYLFLPLVVANECLQCIGSRKTWCSDNSECNWLLLGCRSMITDGYNCPLPVPNGSEYSDEFARNTALPYIAAAYATDPSICLKNQLPTAKLDKVFSVPCSSKNSPPTTCSALTAVDSTQKAIIVSFKGTQGIIQLGVEFWSFLQPKEPFFTNGFVYKYFYDAFMFLWNGGLQAAIQNLETSNPGYSLWVFGHSLGAAEASIFASYAIKTGMFTPDKIKLVTFGQPRTGTRDFAKWHDDTFLYSYRIVHKADAVSRLPPMTGSNGLVHHRYEVWYDNDMKNATDFKVCVLGDGFTCSNAEIMSNWDDHKVYFNRNISDWGAQGCPNT